MSDSWNAIEIEAIVSDYFRMLSCELAGVPYNKSEHRRALARQLGHRSDGSIERKHQNISAVLLELGIPYIFGYKPLSNYQRTLFPQAIRAYLASHPELTRLIEMDVTRPAAVPTVDAILEVLVEPPVSGLIPPRSVRELPADYSPNAVNYLLQEAANHTLGTAGEQLALKFERARLLASGRARLADQIEHVSTTRGNQAGYDIHSFEVDGGDRFIEVKTTKYGIHTPFFLSANELRCSEQHRNVYHLYRFFQFHTAPRLFTLAGFLQDHCVLSPISYLARV